MSKEIRETQDMIDIKERIINSVLGMSESIDGDIQNAQKILAWIYTAKRKETKQD